VAVAGSTTRHPTGQTVEEHLSERRRQPDRPCAKFGCEQCVYLYELKKRGKYQKLRFPYKFVFFSKFQFYEATRKDCCLFDLLTFHAVKLLNFHLFLKNKVCRAHFFPDRLTQTAALRFRLTGPV
jgi:hypothetical protein